MIFLPILHQVTLTERFGEGDFVQKRVEFLTFPSIDSRAVLGQIVFGLVLLLAPLGPVPGLGSLSQTPGNGLIGHAHDVFGSIHNLGFQSAFRGDFGQFFGHGHMGKLGVPGMAHGGRKCHMGQRHKLFKGARHQRTVDFCTKCLFAFRCVMQRGTLCRNRPYVGGGRT